MASSGKMVKKKKWRQEEKKVKREVSKKFLP
jgi:hypothetical protein